MQIRINGKEMKCCQRLNKEVQILSREAVLGLGTMTDYRTPPPLPRSMSKNDERRSSKLTNYSNSSDTVL